MIGVPVEDTLATACEQRLGRRVHVAGIFNLRYMSSPEGRVRPSKPVRAVLALTDAEIWLLDVQNWVVGFSIGAALCRFPRRGLVAQWRRRSWAWPAVWKAELSWPELAIYVDGMLLAGEDAERIMGLLVADEFQNILEAPATGPEEP